MDVGVNRLMAKYILGIFQNFQNDVIDKENTRDN